MATITQTVEEFLPIFKQLKSSKTKVNLPPKTQLELPPQALGCPPDCSCKKTTSYKFQPMQILFNIIGIIVALFATYLIVTTDSNMYIIFWVCYSILRRLSKTKVHAKND